MTEKLLTNLKLSDLWKEFNQNFYESFWEELKQKIKLMKKKFIEAASQKEITFYVGAQRYERTSQREYRRNGYWKRYIILKDGRRDFPLKLCKYKTVPRNFANIAQKLYKLFF